MKKGLLLFVLALGFSLVSLAQQKKPLTVKIQTPTAQCEECKLRIEEYLKYEEGVTKVVVYPRSKYTMVTYFADRTNIENIKAAIANVGYDADDVTANEDAYKKLPKTCKHPKK
ncbi:MAG: heavy-metal-associated domain-containing protein [Chitinophagaceae bacterium]